MSDTPIDWDAATGWAEDYLASPYVAYRNEARAVLAGVRLREALDWALEASARSNNAIVHTALLAVQQRAEEETQ